LTDSPRSTGQRRKYCRPFARARREIEVVAYDPESDPETYRRLADRLLTDDGIAVIFGCSSSAQRKAVLPAIERRNGLLWYPSLYEGFEYSPNVIYTGASPNQTSFPLAEYLVRNHGRRVLMAGSDYMYGRRSYLTQFVCRVGSCPWDRP
jgi:branched-chain amino acid transport system substrate-binding protein